MRWFCVAFGTIVVVSTALSRAGAPSGDASIATLPASAAILPSASEATLAFDVTEISSARRLNHGAAWSATILLGLPFLIRRRRERLS
jgi:hypothetical protein